MPLDTTLVMRAVYVLLARYLIICRADAEQVEAGVIVC